MNKKNYINSVEKLHTSKDFKDKTSKLMKDTLNSKRKKNPIAKKLVLSFASAAIIISASVVGFNYNNLFTSNKGANNNLAKPGITVAEMELPTSTEGTSTRMLPLFVYKGRIYLHYNTTFELNNEFMVDKEDMLNLRGEYLGKTIGSIDEWSNQEDYATEFASTIGESDVYTVKGYDSIYRLMVYSEYPDGFSCEIYDSFGGLTLRSGADYFDLLQFKDNIVSSQWESYDSWNNGKSELSNATIDDAFNEFIDKLYTSTPVDITTDLFTENTDYDSQKFIYLKTKDNLITALRLFKDGYVYAPEVGFFKMDENVFNAFWNTMPATNPLQ